MEYIILILGEPLGYLMYFCFTISKNYCVSLILFTLISKIILFPMSLATYKNAIKFVKIKPQINDIKRYFSGDKDRIADEQFALYKAEKYNPFMDLFSLFIQMMIIVGLIHVMYNPIQYLIQVPKDIIEQLIEAGSRISGVETLGAAAQLKIVDLIQNPAYSSEFAGISPEWISKIQKFNIDYMGMNLGVIPSLNNISRFFLVPLFACLSSLALCIVQNKIHVSQREQSKAAQLGATLFFTAFISFFVFLVPAGMGMYWGFGNLFSILVLVVTNVICKPERHINYTSRTKPLSRVDKAIQKANCLREKESYSRFLADKNKELVFYSSKSGIYKYFRNVLEYVLENSDVKIHYVTSDPDDAIFSKNNPKIIPYYIGDKKLISLMMDLDTNVMVMTMPDLQKYHIKRSMVRKDIEYVYMFHAVASTHMIYRAGAFNHYDTIFCVGQYHMDEIRATEKKYRLSEKRLVPCGYGLIDDLSASYEAMEKNQKGNKKILIAPSWQYGNILETCLDQLLDQLLAKGYHIVVRPHPEFIKRFPEKMDTIISKYKDMFDDNFIIETDFSSNVTIFTADLLISDWSGIAFEYAYSTKRPCLQINTPMKILNSDYKDIGIVPIEVALRDKIGASLDVDEMDKLTAVAENLLANTDDYNRQITETLHENMFCIGHSGEMGGSYILEALGVKTKAAAGVNDA